MRTLLSWPDNICSWGQPTSRKNRESLPVVCHFRIVLLKYPRALCLCQASTAWFLQARPCYSVTHQQLPSRAPGGGVALFVALRSQSIYAQHLTNSAMRRHEAHGCCALVAATRECVTRLHSTAPLLQLLISAGKALAAASPASCSPGPRAKAKPSSSRQTKKSCWLTLPTCILCCHQAGPIRRPAQQFLFCNTRCCLRGSTQWDKLGAVKPCCPCVWTLPLSKDPRGNVYWLKLASADPVICTASLKYACFKPEASHDLGSPQTTGPLTACGGFYMILLVLSGFLQQYLHSTCIVDGSLHLGFQKSRVHGAASIFKSLFHRLGDLYVLNRGLTYVASLLRLSVSHAKVGGRRKTFQKAMNRSLQLFTVNVFQFFSLDSFWKSCHS